MTLNEFTTKLKSASTPYEVMGESVVVTGGYVYLASLTSLPENIQFNNGGHVYLRSLTSLPENIQFNNGGYVYLNSLENEKQRYRGQEVTLRNIDDYTMLILSERQVQGYRVSRCRYFGGGEIENLQFVYTAERGGLAAHGKTIAEAIRDIDFKFQQANVDVEERAQEIRERGVMTFNEYRLLTGACAEGLRRGLQECGLPSDTESLPLEQVLQFSQGKYGGDVIQQLFSEDL